ncbi:hypothetical protein [Nocardioides sp. AX2bis]|uniref:hypothetical protein n=1 Tax=Nocardioides sp. AX2bis TaxID=2653157 RepID=UPI0012F3B6AB|nr:hypothetical protein [Nocardioides sp. AX2bis]VXB75607.1 conserved hypothetical protein [Nocardioides sp. AX2bis]
MGRRVLYLHGVGERVRGGRWRSALDRALASHGLAPLRQGEDLLVPDYVDLLAGDRVLPVPPACEPTYDAVGAAAARGAFMVERQRLADVLGAPVAGRHLVPSPVYEAGRHLWGAVSASMRHVEHYRRDPALRHRVLDRVLTGLDARARPATGDDDEVVVLAHSLGSLVALDLLPHLPAGVRVPRLVTLGSPAGWPSLHRGPGRTQASFPYDRVGSWVNLHSPRDLVPLGRGSARLFPAAVDLPVRLPPARHGAELYLGVPAVARVLADALGVLPPGPDRGVLAAGATREAG